MDDRDRQRLGNLIGHAQAAPAPDHERAEGSCRRRGTETAEGHDATPRVAGDDQAAAAATTRIEVSLAENFLR